MVISKLQQYSNHRRSLYIFSKMASFQNCPNTLNVSTTIQPLAQDHFIILHLFIVHLPLPPIFTLHQPRNHLIDHLYVPFLLAYLIVGSFILAFKDHVVYSMRTGVLI
jgi:hypothetical protein